MLWKLICLQPTSNCSLLERIRTGSGSSTANGDISPSGNCTAVWLFILLQDMDNSTWKGIFPLGLWQCLNTGVEVVGLAMWFSTTSWWSNEWVGWSQIISPMGVLFSHAHQNSVGKCHMEIAPTVIAGRINQASGGLWWILHCALGAHHYTPNFLNQTCLQWDKTTRQQAFNALLLQAPQPLKELKIWRGITADSDSRVISVYFSSKPQITYITVFAGAISHKLWIPIKCNYCLEVRHHLLISST